jgi:hypothetical protein
MATRRRQPVAEICVCRRVRTQQYYYGLCSNIDRLKCLFGIRVHPAEVSMTSLSELLKF